MATWQVATDRIEQLILDNDMFKQGATNIIKGEPDNSLASQQDAAAQIKQAFINRATKKIQTIIIQPDGTQSMNTEAWILNIVIQDYLAKGVDWLGLVQKYWGQLRG